MCFSWSRARWPSPRTSNRRGRGVLGGNGHDLAGAHGELDRQGVVLAREAEVEVFLPGAAAHEVVGQGEGLVPAGDEGDGLLVVVDEAERADGVVEVLVQGDDEAVAHDVAAGIRGHAVPTHELPALLAQGQVLLVVDGTAVGVLLGGGAHGQVGVQGLVRDVRGEQAMVAGEVDHDARATPLGGEHGVAVDLDLTGGCRCSR